MKIPEISVIISTYNQPDWLEKVLWSYEFQKFKNFELLIADDGSQEETANLIRTLKAKLSFPIQHVWHEDQGFRKTIILNKTIQKTNSPYLVFSDGDCVARADFLEKHMFYRDKGIFLSGGYFKLPKNISEQITIPVIKSQVCFKAEWLREKGMPSSFKLNKLSSSGFKEKFLNTITPTKATWNGMNSSGWKDDIVAANGFDERMQYGGEDRELGERLFNKGIKAKQIRYSAVCLHLYHERGYVKQEMIDKNKAIRKITKSQKIQRTSYGIEKLKS